MNRIHGWLLIFIIALVAVITPARSFEILPPVLAPACPAQFSESVKTVDGKDITSSPGELYCVVSDGEWLKGKSRLLQQISGAVENLGSIKTISLSANLFDGILVSQWLCSLPISNSTSLRLFVQKSDISILSPSAHLTAKFIDNIDKCFNDIRIKLIGCDVHDGDKQCTPNYTNTYHVKGIRVEAERGIVYAFGSGNLTPSSMTRNVENWLVGISEQPVKPFDCLFQYAGILAENPGLRFSQQRSIYNGCVALADEPENLRVIPLPFNERDFKSEIEKLTSASKDVVLVGQFIESKWLFNVFKSNPSVHVTILVDSSYYYASIDETGKEYNFINRKMAKDFFDAAGSISNVSVRFLMTNHNYEAHGQTNTVHARSVLFDGDTPALLVGSVHWKDGAFVSNAEEEIFLYGDLAKSQRSFMDNLLARSVAKGDLPITSTAAIPSAKAE